MIDVYFVTIKTVNKKGKIHVEKFEYDSLSHATRYVRAYKPKRNYEVLSYLIEKGMILL